MNTKQQIAESAKAVREAEEALDRAKLAHRVSEE
jgi:hypothetical protein